MLLLGIYESRADFYEERKIDAVSSTGLAAEAGLEANRVTMTL